MKYGINTLDDFRFQAKTVLCRVDINSPLDRESGCLQDITRLEGCVPTIRELADCGAKVVLLAHQGGDLEYKNYASTQPHAQVLTRLVGRPVEFVDDVCGPAARIRIKNLRMGEILLLDNVRFVAEEMTLFENKLKLSPEEQAKTLLVRKLAPLADIYVCDAFAAVHRSQPSLVGLEQLLPSAMGRLFEKEYTVLSKLREDPARPCIFVLGGAKIQDAFIMMRSVLRDRVADQVLTGGLVANIMLIAAGVDIGKASTEFIKRNNLEEFIETGRQILQEFQSKVLMPTDLAYVAGNRQEVMVDQLLPDQLLVDIGHQTVENYCRLLAKAGTIFVNGPVGIFEEPESEYGTKAIWKAMADSPAYSVLGGGDSITAMNKFHLTGQFSYVCTAGGGLVRFLSNEELPVVKALKEAAVKFGQGRETDEI